MENKRLETWLRKLLDLTLRNPLINLRPARGIGVLSPSPQLILDALRQVDAEVNLVAFPWSATPQPELDAWLQGGMFSKSPNCPDENQIEDASSPEEALTLLRDESTSKGRRRRRADDLSLALKEALDVYRNEQIVVDAEVEDLQDDLSELDRQQRLRQQEGGVHTLFLSFGLLRWKEQEKATNWIESPLVLVPVALKRENAQSPYTLSLRDEDAVFNPSLTHKIMQDFELDIQVSLQELTEKAQEELKQHLQDESEQAQLQVQETEWNFEDVVAAVQEKISVMKDWIVLPEMRLGLFSFHKQHLWNDLSARAETVLSHPVVGQITGQMDDPHRLDPLVAWNKLDQDYSPQDILTPLPVDASQMRALTLIDQGHNLVIDGPPGTGKSQTITNLIAHALGKGKTVLFVSEKATALGVVHDRLEDLNLGPFCLELHAAKAQKSEVIGQFRRVVDLQLKHDAHTWSKRADELHQQRLYLNKAMDELHEARPNGYSLFQGIGQWTALQSRGERLGLEEVWLDLEWGNLAIQNAQDYEVQRKAVLSWARAQQNLPPTAKRFKALAGRSLPEEDRLFVTMDQALDALNQLEGSYRALGLTHPYQSLAELYSWFEACRLANDPTPTAWREWLLENNNAERAKEYRELKHRRSELWSGLSSVYKPQIWSMLAHWVPQWHQSLTKNPWGKWWSQRGLRQQLAPYTVQGVSPSVPHIDQLLHALPEWNTIQKDLRKLGTDIDERLKKWIRKNEDWNTLENGEIWSEKALALIERHQHLSPQGAVALKIMLIHPPKVLNTALVEQQQQLLEQYDDAQSQWRRWFPLGHEGWPDQGEHASVVQWKESWQTWKAARPGWAAWRQSEQATTQLQTQGADRLMEMARQHQWSPDQIEHVWQKAYWSNWIAQVQESIPEFDAMGRQREQMIEEFSILDEEVEFETRNEILGRLYGRWQTAQSQAPLAEMRLLMREMGKKRAHLPPRQLLGQIPNLWPSMKPCLLMSPLSVAQHLGPDTPSFDLVIFDEASQIPVADAIGVIARGKQIIVVGDPKQMPPSRLFDSSEDDDEIGDGFERDLDSILDECVAHMNRVQLNWHYRSKHEDLIAFSNHRYYNGELITFPSPQQTDVGIVVHDVKGQYERGLRRVNRQEAEAVVEAIIKHYSKPGKKSSLGVITFNQNQQRLINKLLDAARAENPTLDAALSREEEEIFIKNLDTVQGDERDVIYFSTTFAPDESGSFPMNFGPLGQRGGERRLNVAITRARERVEIFTSFHPGQLDVSRVAHQGIRDFRDYLTFARGGEDALLAVSTPTVGLADSPFELDVRHRLEKLGWRVQPQVGCSGYRIDMAVFHPHKPGVFLAGIECDGATYHSFKVARDRDRMRQRVLERLGWKILRIWSTDWWQDPTYEIDRIHNQLKDQLALEKSHDDIPPAAL